jgi:hypothetical protein
VSDAFATVAARLATGDTLLAVSFLSFANVNVRDHVTLVAVRPNCTLDTAFGTGGIESMPLPGTGGGSSYISEMVATPTGVAIAGDDGPLWIVRELTLNGTPKVGFAAGGWAHGRPPRSERGFPASVEGLAMGSNGSLLLGADAQPHCCTYEAVGKLKPNGSIDTAFGHYGWTHVFKEGANLQSIIPESDDRIGVLAQTQFMGCGFMSLATLNRRGVVERAVTSNLSATQRSIPPNDLNAGVAYEDAAGGLGVIGWGHRQCQLPMHWPGAFTYSEILSPAGRLVGPRRYLTPTSYSPTVGAFVSNSRFVAGSLNSRFTVFSLREIFASGAANGRFGANGALEVRLSQSSSLVGYAPVMTQGPFGDVVVIVEEPPGPKVLEIVG